MSKQISTWQFILDSLRIETPVALMYVLESNGSSPGRQGFCMAVNAVGEMQGSVGGGIMEHKFVEMVKTLLVDNDHPTQFSSVKKQVHDKQAAANQSGMICSGDQTIFLYKVQRADKPHISNLMVSLKNNQNGTLQLSPAGIRFSNSIPKQNFLFEKESDSNWLYAEKTGYKNQLYVAGGGHCSLALCKLMSGMDFYIHLFDDRANLNTMAENCYAHEKHLLNDYSELQALIPPGINHYVLLMTMGYRTDDIALRALLNKEFKYFGVLGSSKKIEKMFSDYIAEGISEERLRQIHAPVGMLIHSHTPEEIAVSIAAQMIEIKNRR